jgi:hypothetical protein
MASSVKFTVGRNIKRQTLFLIYQVQITFWSELLVDVQYTLIFLGLNTNIARHMHLTALGLAASFVVKLSFRTVNGKSLLAELALKLNICFGEHL